MYATQRVFERVYEAIGQIMVAIFRASAVCDLRVYTSPVQHPVDSDHHSLDRHRRSSTTTNIATVRSVPQLLCIKVLMLELVRCTSGVRISLLEPGDHVCVG